MSSFDPASAGIGFNLGLLFMFLAAVLIETRKK